MRELVVLGDEAVALGALHAGLTAAYAYPGTPSTEILECLLRHAHETGVPIASWTANEKTAYEAALGVSMAGRRALVAMKHVGLNVAADPFVNSALVDIHGGLVVAVADDPGMHSSQNEQDSRVLADFAHVPCFEPATAQEAYDMTREAFDVSERFHIPVVVRLVTRVAHSRGVIRVREPRDENPLAKAADPAAWTLLPANARRQWRALLDRQTDLAMYAAASPHNVLTLDARELGVITTGIARNYYLENLDDLGFVPSHLHIGLYPAPVEAVRLLAGHVSRVLVVEEGYPYVERQLRGLLPPPVPVLGKLSGALPLDGELTPDVVRRALGLPGRPSVALEGFTLPNRPPQLCPGCPHADMFKALRLALEAYPAALVTSDIGCYTLGALPPYGAIESCVCMGASIGMARGAADAGLHPVVAVIGDSTFLHSGLTPLLDAVVANANVTVIVLDNEVVAMTGGQPSLVPSSRIESLVRGLGVDPDHLHIVAAHPRRIEENAAIIRRELEYRGLSVIVGVRECVETARAKKRRVPDAAPVTA
jgi:indolepyruvate ferredoxin oxidoreductase alpha subunit